MRLGYFYCDDVFPCCQRNCLRRCPGAHSFAGHLNGTESSGWSDRNSACCRWNGEAVVQSASEKASSRAPASTVRLVNPALAWPFITMVFVAVTLGCDNARKGIDARGSRFIGGGIPCYVNRIDFTGFQSYNYALRQANVVGKSAVLSR